MTMHSKLDFNPITALPREVFAPLTMLTTLFVHLLDDFLAIDVTGAWVKSVRLCS